MRHRTEWIEADRDIKSKVSGRYGEQLVGPVAA